MKSLATFAAAAVLLPAGFLLSRSEAAGAPPEPAPAGASIALDGPVSGTYVIDPVHSSVLFGVKHAGAARFYGRFNSLKGEFTIDAENPAESSVLIVIPADSIDTNDDGRDQHLTGPDFFNAKEFPEVIFESTAVAAAEGGFKVEGDMTLLGVTKPVSAMAEFIGHAKSARSGKNLTGYEVTLRFNRSDFGMNFMVGPSLGDEVRVIVSVEASEK